VFELSPSGSGWIETTLHQFTGGADGGAPYGDLIFDAAGNLYGAATQGGVGLGTLYELTPGQGGWDFNVIYTFTGNQAAGPYSLTMDAASNLYGTSGSGGNNGGFGTVYKLTRSGGGWTYTSLHDFDFQGSDGGMPYGSVVLDASGNVYGTTARGPYPYPDDGGIFEITP
jgi:uncharacterized repeat protein (TIGR03803 family)